MQTDKYTDFLNYLKRKAPKPTSSKELADYFNVTTRTIRNWVRMINDEKRMILSSNLGYLLKESQMLQNYNDLSRYKDNGKDRRARIFLELLKQKQQQLDLFDLADTLFISDSTLRNDIQRLRQEITTDSLQISIENNQVKLVGDERDKRRYMVSLLYSETNMNTRLRAKIEEMIDALSISEIERDIRTVLSDDFEVLFNQYLVRNIAIHFVVTLERIKQGNVLLNRLSKVENKLSKEIKIAQRIADRISDRYGIPYPKNEIIQLAVLFIGLSEKQNSYSAEYKLNEIISGEFKKKMNDILQKTQELYLIDLSSPLFKSQLMIHVHNLLIRSKYDSYERNSNLIGIKIAYPIIYDVSVYIASLIQKEFNVHIPEDEISFIALHIGSTLEDQDLGMVESVYLLIVADDYQNIRMNIESRLKKVLSHNIVIESTSQYSDSPFNYYDILISPDREVLLKDQRAVFVNPFLLAKDLAKIEKRIEKVKVIKRNEQMLGNIKRYFSEKLYYNQMNCTDCHPEDLIVSLSEKMISHQLVNENFTSQILAREKLASTSFPSGIAVPHSVNLEANQTSIAVGTLQSPMMWGEQKVSLVVLTAINKEDAKHFNYFFQKFIEVVSDKMNVKLLAASESYKKFISQLSEMLSSEHD